MSQAGAPAALQGYRLQALYTLGRVLGQGDGEWIFQPEGMEDLDILDNSDKPVELIQVKSYHSLQLSDLAPLSPEKSGSFFGRVTSTLNTANPPAIKLVNFGQIGPELSRGWITHGNERTSIMEKLAEAGYSQPQIDQILANVELVNLEEAEEEAKVYNLLSQALTGIDPSPAFELLQFWLFTCMERRERITYGDVVEKLQQVGRFLAERRDFHDQWFTTIQPLENSLITSEKYENLQKEFYEGGFTRYEHILANLDFYREQKLSEIKLGFETNNVVIVHAASGQGKTTLAYRYLHDRFPTRWRFAIQRIESIQHAMSVANALNGHANVLQVPMAIFIDVHPRDASWTELVKQLSRHPYLQILVTIREEDFRRANVSGAEFDFADVDLEFHEQEARLIYERAKASLSIPGTRFLNFDDAWAAFGMRGPLLEFVYLLTQTTTLRQRLESQVNRIRHEVRERNLASDELKLLILAAIATAYETRLDTRKLISFLELPEPTLSLEYFEKEYLIRASNDGQFIEGLHSIRSSILVQLLTSTNFPSWQEAAIEVIPLIVEEDIESFLLHAFVDRPNIDHSGLLEAISNFVPNEWVGIAGILRSLLWIGVRNYIYANWAVIEAAHEEFGSGWFFFLDMNFAGDEGPKIGKWWTEEVFSRFFSQERIAKTEEIRAKQTQKDDVFALAKKWLAVLTKSPLEPASIADWVGLAEVLYWAKRFEVLSLEEWISDDTLDKATQEIPLPVLGDVVYALFFTEEQRYRNWLKRNKETLQARLAVEYNVISLQENGSLLTLHFLPTPREAEEEIKDLLHHEAIERLQLIRQLYPSYEKYGSQGYGHKLGPLELKLDSTKKPGVEKAYLVPDLVTRLNGIASGFARNQFRLETWDEYVAAILNIRQLIVTCLGQLPPGLGKFLERRNPVNVGADHIDKADWQECVDLVNYPPDLPKIAIDQWGFASEISAKLLVDGNQQKLIPSAIALRKYKQYLEIQRKYFSSVHNFILQTVDVTATNFNLNKLPPQRSREGIIAEIHKRGIKTDMAHLSSRNLWEARQTLFKYQREFRQLFGDRVDSEMLNTVERQESELFEQLWQLWYFYAYEPQQILPHALRKVPQNIETAKIKLERELQQALATSNTEDVKAELLQTDLKWESLSAKWIKLDVEDATKLYVAFETLVTSLQAVLSPIKFQDLAYYLIEENFPHIVIVPTVNGRMINENVWPLFSASTVMKQTPLEEQNWVSYLPKPLPPQVREKLDIEVWDLPGLNQANQFSVAVSALMLLTSQVSEFKNLPDPEEAGLEVLRIHLAERSEALSEALQAYIDTGAILLDTFNSLSKGEIELHPNLLEAVLTLQEINNSILPDWSGEIQMELSEIVKYAQKLSEVFLIAEYIKLLWIADIMDHG
ncbi:MAG: hypothetical protein KJ063_24965 [Anaerolineae bacterium]|nr:hypothetical protein [Anaerolineae bacterium]